MAAIRSHGELREPMAGAVDRLPPFWELENLIAAGLDQDDALSVMAARRQKPRLVAGDALAAESAADARARIPLVVLIR